MKERNSYYHKMLYILYTMILLGALSVLSACGVSSNDDGESMISNEIMSENLEGMIPKEKYDALVEEKSRLAEEYESVKNELSASKKNIEDANNKYVILQKEFDDYKNKMGAYESLSEAEAQAKEFEALRIVEEKKAAKAAKEAEEKEKREAEIRKGYDTGITYDQINRLPDDYKDKKVKFSGYVMGTLEGDDATAVFLATSGKDKDILICLYQPGEGKPRVFKEDTITVCGTSAGLYKNKTDDGQNIVLPTIVGESIEISKSKASSGSGKSSTSSGSSSKGTGTGSGSQNQSSASNATGYQEIYDEYVRKIKDATPRLVNEYNSEAAGKGSDIMALAEIHNNKLSELAAISTEGVEKMASYMYTKGGGNYAEYQEWSTKLYSVYMEEGTKITNAYMSSCYGAFGF